jgi:hypothetical protein
MHISLYRPQILLVYHVRHFSACKCLQNAVSGTRIAGITGDMHDHTCVDRLQTLSPQRLLQRFKTAVPAVAAPS